MTTACTRLDHTVNQISERWACGFLAASRRNIPSVAYRPTIMRKYSDACGVRCATATRPARPPKWGRAGGTGSRQRRGRPGADAGRTAWRLPSPTGTSIMRPPRRTGRAVTVERLGALGSDLSPGHGLSVGRESSLGHALSGGKWAVGGKCALGVEGGRGPGGSRGDDELDEEDLGDDPQR